MLVLDAPPGPDNDPTSWYVSADALADAAEATGRRAVVVATMAECLNEQLRPTSIGRGLTPLLGLAEGLAALAGRCPGRAALRSTHMPCRRSRARPGSSTRRKRNQACEPFDIAVPDGVAATSAEVQAAAEKIGYPITLKALGAGTQERERCGEGRLGRRPRAGRGAGSRCRRRPLPRRGDRDRRGRRGARRRASRSADRVAGHARLRRRDDRGVERRDPPARTGHRATMCAERSPGCAAIRC